MNLLRPRISEILIARIHSCPTWLLQFNSHSGSLPTYIHLDSNLMGEVQTFTRSLQTQKRIVPKDPMCQDSIPLTSIKPSLTILPLVPSSATGSSPIRFQEPSESASMDWLPCLSWLCRTYIKLVLNLYWTYVKLDWTMLNYVKLDWTMLNYVKLRKLNRTPVFTHYLPLLVF